MTWSIRSRLTVWYTLIVVAVVGAAAVAVALAHKQLALQSLDDELASQMLTLEGVMRTEFDEHQDLPAAAAEASMEVIAPDRAFILVRPDGHILAQWGEPLPSAWRPPAGKTVHDTIVADSGHSRVFSQPVKYRNRVYVAAVIAPLSGLEAEHAMLLRALTIGVLVALVVAGVGGWVVGRQTLRPLADLARQASTMSDRDPSARLTSPHPDDEAGRLATAFNGLLDRLAVALNAQRQFMADASHELRTPVSVVRTTAQVTLAKDARPEGEYRESLAIVAEQSARLAHLVNAMFLLSRAEANGIPLMREPVYVDDVVGESVRAQRMCAGSRNVAVRTSGDTEVTFSGDDMLLRQMVGNLLDNAIRHATQGGTVTASVQRTKDAITIRVCDDGAGIPPGEQERIFDRFVRLNSHSGGAGLGLPIARWIAEAHGGKLVLESSSASGSCFRVTLPVA